MSALANQPAFPYAFQHEDGADFTVCGISLGMTLRQYYAGKALAGLLADPSGSSSYEGFARKSVNLADALIAELEKTK